VSKNILKIVGIFILGIFGGIFADQILWPYFIERPLFYRYRLEQSPIYVTEKKEVIIQENTALKNAIEKVEKAVVGVKTVTKTKKILEGSGLIVTSDGLIVTLANLVPQGSISTFYIDGKQVPIKILKRDLENNLALIQVEEKNLPIVGFADLGKIKLGERVFLVGVEFEKQNVKKIVNEGIVKSFDEKSIGTNISERYTLDGSPLFNIEAQVLGLNTIDENGKVIAIPISKIKQFVGM